MTDSIPKTFWFSSQKHNVTMHRPGPNKVTELNIFRAVVNVMIFLWTSLSATTPKETTNLKYVFHYISLPDETLPINMHIYPKANI